MKYDPKDIERRKTLYPDWKADGIPVKFECPACSEPIMRAHPTEKILICTRCGIKTKYPEG